MFVGVGTAKKHVIQKLSHFLLSIFIKKCLMFILSFLFCYSLDEDLIEG